MTPSCSLCSPRRHRRPLKTPGQPAIERPKPRTRSKPPVSGAHRRRPSCGSARPHATTPGAVHHPGAKTDSSHSKTALIRRDPRTAAGPSQSEETLGPTTSDVVRSAARNWPQGGSALP